MFKKSVIAVLLLTGWAQAGVIDQMPQRASLQEFVAYLSEHRDAVAEESTHVNASVTFVKDANTSPAAWIGLLQHIIETMKVENATRFVGKINEVMYDEQIANLHGGFYVTIGAKNSDKQSVNTDNFPEVVEDVHE